MALAQNITYTATGSEGSSVSLPDLIGQKVLLCFLGDKILVNKIGAPGVNDYQFQSSTGTITVGVPIQPSQILQVIYRNP